MCNKNPGVFSLKISLDILLKSKNIFFYRHLELLANITQNKIAKKRQKPRLFVVPTGKMETEILFIVGPFEVIEVERHLRMNFAILTLKVIA